MATSRKDSPLIADSRDVLSSWKTIADYFHCDARTAKRWEKERGLPVHRPPGGRKGLVIAYRDELDAWLGAQEPSWKRDSEPLSASDPLPAESAPEPEKEIPAALAPSRPLLPVAFRRWSLWTAKSAYILLLSAAVYLIFSRFPLTSVKSAPSRSPAGAAEHIPAPGAEALYLRGRYFASLRTPAGLAEAIDAYTEAIVKDPVYAQAYAGLAEAYDLLPQSGHADPAQALTHAKDAADRAIALAPQLASAHRAKAYALFFWDWDLSGSDAEFRYALALDPNSADTHQWYADTLLGRLEGAECLKQIDEALRLDPTSASIATDAAAFHAIFGDPKTGLDALREIARSQPALPTPSHLLAEIDFARGDYPAYVADTHRFAAVSGAPDDRFLASAVARGWRRAGKTGLLQARAAALESAFARGVEPGYHLGQTLLLLGAPQKALPYFQASLDRHSAPLVAMAQYPWAKPFAGDPGYAALFAQIRSRTRGGANYPAAPPIYFDLPQ